MQIDLGTIDVDPRVLDKRPHFTESIHPDVQIFDTCNIKKPSFILTVGTGLTTYNYMHIPEWNAYYFLLEPDVFDGVRCLYHAEMDVLTTFADDIKDRSAYLIRTGDDSKRNKFIRDSKQPAQSNRKCRTYTFDRTPFTANYGADLVYLLTVIGGKHT